MTVAHVFRKDLGHRLVGSHGSGINAVCSPFPSLVCSHESLVYGYQLILQKQHYFYPILELKEPHHQVEETVTTWLQLNKHVAL